MLSTDPSYDNRTIASTLKMQIAGLPRITGRCPGWWKQSFRLWLWSLVWFQERATSFHLISSKSAWKSTRKCTWMCWRVWWSPGAIRWPVADPGCGSRTAATPRICHRPPDCPQVQRDPGLASEGVLRLCTLLSLAPLLPRPEPAGLHTSRTSPTWSPTTPKPAWSPPSASACGKGMLPVPDPYWGGDWGWRRLHWIDVSSTT